MIEISLNIGFLMLIAAIALAAVRLVIGPTLPDRVVALDNMTIIVIAFCALYGILADDPKFLDVALALALVGFLATVALARFAERRIERSKDQDLDDPIELVAAPGEAEK